MKRFFADAVLILMLVAIGSYINQRDKSDISNVIHDKVDQFEDEVAQNKVVKKKTDTVSLGNIIDNNATKMAKGSSEFVVDTMEGCVNIFSSLFDGLIK